MLTWTAAGILVLIAAGHSFLGEKLLLPSLLAGESGTKMPRAVARRVIRLAWHLTSLAWVGLAAALVGAPIVWVFAAVCFSAFLIIFTFTPGHLAWPLFLAATALSLLAEGLIAAPVLWAAIGVAVAVAAGAGIAHVLWAFGVRAGTANVIPQTQGEGKQLFQPQGPVTLLVALALLGYGALVVVHAGGHLPQLAAWTQGLLIAAIVVLTLRVFGEGRWVGVTKTERDTGFAKADDRYWTPAAAILALGAVASLTLG